MNKRIVKARNNMEYTQKELALHCNTSVKNVEAWESGKVKPSLYSVVKLSIALDVSLDQLVKGVR